MWPLGDFICPTDGFLIFLRPRAAGRREAALGVEVAVQCGCANPKRATNCEITTKLSVGACGELKPSPKQTSQNLDERGERRRNALRTICDWRMSAGIDTGSLAKRVDEFGKKRWAPGASRDDVGISAANTARHTSRFPIVSVTNPGANPQIRLPLRNTVAASALLPAPAQAGMPQAAAYCTAK